MPLVKKIIENKPDTVNALLFIGTAVMVAICIFWIAILFIDK